MFPKSQTFNVKLKTILSTLSSCCCFIYRFVRFPGYLNLVSLSPTKTHNTFTATHLYIHAHRVHTQTNKTTYSLPLVPYDHISDKVMYSILSKKNPHTYKHITCTIQQQYMNKLNTFFNAKDHLQSYVGNMFPLSQSQDAPKQACGSRHSSAHTAICLHSGTLCLSGKNIMVQVQKYTLLINVFK